MKKLSLLLSCIFFFNTSFAVTNNPTVILLKPQQMTIWGTPKSLPAGAHDLVLDGNASETGLYTLRLKLPANYKIMPYIQNNKTFITVIKGSYNVGIGNKFNASKGTNIPAGGFIVIPANVAVFTWTNEPTIIQMHGEGPLNVKLVQPPI